MSKPLIVRFTGLCLFVPGRKHGFVTVLLPDAKRGRKGIDGRDLVPHEARLVHRPAPGGQVERYLLPPELELTSTTAGALADLRSIREAPILNVNAIAPGHAVIPIQPQLGLASQIRLKAGSAHGAEYTRRWRIERRLDHDELPPDHPTGLVAASMIAWRIDDPALPDHEFVDAHAPDKRVKLGDMTGSIEIWHVPPRHLPGRPDHDHDRPRCDDDFRWYYEMLKDRPGLQHRLKAGGAPIPCQVDPDPAALDNGNRRHRDALGSERAGGREHERSREGTGGGAPLTPAAARVLVPTMHTCLPAYGECDGDECDEPPG